MQVYEVGGAVRDALLGRAVQDIDYVVVGATVDEMLALNYRPVGGDFPIFLHPETHAEYALARTERKTAPGYKGFVFHAAPEITLEQDLARRDLTINAIARAPDGTLIDPYGGVADLKAGVLRHVSAAFAEDPVRILRVARFAARFGFDIAPETQALMVAMVQNGEVNALVPERVWQEFAKGLMELQPSRMFAALRACGALQRIMPELDCLWGVPQQPKPHPEIDTGIHIMMVLDYAAAQTYPLAVRVAALLHDLGKGLTKAEYLPAHPGHEESGAELVKALCARLRIPADIRDVAVHAARWHAHVHQGCELKEKKLVELLNATDAQRRPERFTLILQACACDHFGRQGFETVPYPQLDYLQGALNALQALSIPEIIKNLSPQQIPEAIHAAKLRAMRTYIKQHT
jgi:tRNA nucleotidyltransferase (CCA-adding enzyme)